MGKIRNRKRLSALVVAFMLVFTVGAAFALVPGYLDIVGTVTVPRPVDAVEWNTASSFGANGTEVTHSIVNERGLDSQRILWTVDFTDAVLPAVVGASMWDDLPDWLENETGLFAFLAANAINEANMDATITYVGYEWTFTGLDEADSAVLAAALGLTLHVFDDYFVGNLAAGAISEELGVAIYWDSSTSFEEDMIDVIMELLDLDDEEDIPLSFELTLEITFSYAPA
jgi:hypothetical protein